MQQSAAKHRLPIDVYRLSLWAVLVTSIEPKHCTSDRVSVEILIVHRSAVLTCVLLFGLCCCIVIFSFDDCWLM